MVEVELLEGGESVWLELEVGIEEEEKVAGGFLSALVAGPGFAVPVFRERFAGDGGGVVLLGNLGGLVVGLVVDDDDLVGWLGLVVERGQKGLEVLFFVSSRDDDGDFLWFLNGG